MTDLAPGWRKRGRRGGSAYSPLICRPRAPSWSGDGTCASGSGHSFIFAQGTTAWPALYADSLYWIVDLYSSAALYPLSDQFYLADERRSYFKHAATAFVQAHTGRVLLVADSVRDPIAETWIRRFPRLFVSWAAIPPELAGASPPVVDAALATAEAFAAAGGRGAQPEDDSRGDSRAAPARLASTDHADSILASGQPPCVAAAPGQGPCTWSVPLVDAGDRVAGLVVATGGLDRGLAWVPLDSIGPRWSAALERLQHESDSVVAIRHETSVARGRVRLVLIGHRLALFQPQYAWHANAAPTLISGAVVMGESAWGGGTFIDAVGGSGSAAGAGAGRDSAWPRHRQPSEHVWLHFTTRCRPRCGGAT